MELEKLNSLAFLSVARGCGFVLLGISCVMAGAAFDFAVSFLSGGILCLITCLILISKALYAPHFPYKRTEVWLMLEREDRPSASSAQQLIGGTLMGMYYKFARSFAFLASLLFVASLMARH